MAKRYIPIAIDHGTTNSCIAMMTPHGPKVISVEGEELILPSAVFYDKQGNLRVGSAARNAMLTVPKSEGTGYTSYKPKIGSDLFYDFTAARKKMKAPELGAIVIGTLLRAYCREIQTENADACVITIPANFAQNQVEGTREAAEMAGLRHFPLIMEPIAAAMCYGYTASQQRACWMVFDIGGGTLDVSLILARKGRLIVPEGGHAGDAELGGIFFDRLLAGYVLTQLEQKYKLKKFRALPVEGSTEWGRLLLAVEEAKIILSCREESLVKLDTPLCKDDHGKEVELAVPVTRNTYEGLIHSQIERAVQICQSLLKKMRLKSSDVEKVIMIGGPSKTPLIIHMLQDRLGIPLENSIDPMTAVAEGAAIYANGYEIPGSEVFALPGENNYSIRMEYDRQSSLPTYTASGEVIGPSVENLQVQVERLDGRWKSPLITVDSTGVFTVDLQLIQEEKSVPSLFRTVLISKFGRDLCNINEPEIWFPSREIENRLANSWRVAVHGNTTEELISSGTVLPASGRGIFTTTKALVKGSHDDLLQIPVLESLTNMCGTENTMPSGCLHVGSLVIKGSDEGVSMNVPAGSEIEIEIIVDTSRHPEIRAYIPLLSAYFTTKFHKEAFRYELSDLLTRFGSVGGEIAEISKFNAEHPQEEVTEVLENIERTDMVAGLEEDFKRAQAGETSSEVRAYKRLLELEGTLLELKKKQRPDRIQTTILSLEKAVREGDHEALAHIKRDSAYASTDEEQEKILDALNDLSFTVRGRPWFELMADIIALSGETVNNRQHAAFEEASALLNSIDEKGGLPEVTDDDIDELSRLHTLLCDLHTNLYDLREQKVGPLLSRGGGLITDIAKLRK